MGANDVLLSDILRGGRWQGERVQAVYRIQADWDPEAGVWCATSDDVPGLATEADTIESLTAKLRVMIPELLEANRAVPVTGSTTISFELISHRQESIRLAS